MFRWPHTRKSGVAVVVCAPLLTMALLGCSSGFWSSSTPSTEQLSCTATDVPIPVEGYAQHSGHAHAGERRWECGPPPCPAGEVPTWRNWGSDSFVVRNDGCRSTEQAASQQTRRSEPEPQSPVRSAAPAEPAPPPRDVCESASSSQRVENLPPVPAEPPLGPFVNVTRLLEAGYVRDATLACRFGQVARTPLSVGLNDFRSASWIPVALSDIAAPTELDKLRTFPRYATLLREVLLDAQRNWQSAHRADVTVARQQNEQASRWTSYTGSAVADAQRNMASALALYGGHQSRDSNLCAGAEARADTQRMAPVPSRAPLEDFISVDSLLEDGYVRDPTLSCQFSRVAQLPQSVDLRAWRSGSWQNLASMNVNATSETEKQYLFTEYTDLLRGVLVEASRNWESANKPGRDEAQQQRELLLNWISHIGSQMASAERNR